MASSSTVNQQAPLGFLDLPGEVRNQIYRHALRRSVIHANHPWSRCPEFKAPPRKPKWPFLGLLLTCKEIHREASYILYQHGHVQVYAAASNFSIECFNLSTEIGKRFERNVDSVKNVQVNIGWLVCNRHGGFPLWPSTSVRTLCNALVKLPCLQTVKIIWLCFDSDRKLWLKYARPDDELHGKLMQPFARLQEKLPGLRVKVETGQSLKEYKTEDLATTLIVPHTMTGITHGATLIMAPLDLAAWY